MIRNLFSKTLITVTLFFSVAAHAGHYYTQIDGPITDDILNYLEMDGAEVDASPEIQALAEKFKSTVSPFYNIWERQFYLPSPYGYSPDWVVTFDRTPFRKIAFYSVYFETYINTKLPLGLDAGMSLNEFEKILVNRDETAFTEDIRCYKTPHKNKTLRVCITIVRGSGYNPSKLFSVSYENPYNPSILNKKGH